MLGPECTQVNTVATLQCPALISSVSVMAGRLVGPRYGWQIVNRSAQEGETCKAKLSAPLPPPAAELDMFGDLLIASFVVLCLLLGAFCFGVSAAKLVMLF